MTFLQKIIPLDKTVNLNNSSIILHFIYTGKSALSSPGSEIFQVVFLIWENLTVPELKVPNSEPIPEQEVNTFNLFISISIKILLNVLLSGGDAN